MKIFDEFKKSRTRRRLEKQLQADLLAAGSDPDLVDDAFVKWQQSLKAELGEEWDLVAKEGGAKPEKQKYVV